MAEYLCVCLLMIKVQPFHFFTCFFLENQEKCTYGRNYRYQPVFAARQIERQYTMKLRHLSFFGMYILLVLLAGCSNAPMDDAVITETRDPGENPVQESFGGGMKIVFLHHSTGDRIWQGGVPQWFQRYNDEHGTEYHINEQVFPKSAPYGWNNFPYDYWNIWVNHAGSEPYLEEPTLEMLSRQYDVIIWKHCFPVSGVLEDTGKPAINSPEKRSENYRLHYEALKKKMHEFPGNTFIVWTGAALVKNTSLKRKIVSLLRGGSDDENARRARKFFDWVKNEWDEPGDNIYLWDFFELETGGGVFLKNDYATSSLDSHPNRSFSEIAAPLFCRRIIDVIEGRGDSSSITGK